MGHYMIKYLSEIFTLQEDQTIDGKVSKEGEILIKYEYLSLMKAETNCYWKYHEKSEFHNINPYHCSYIYRGVSYK